MNFSLRNKDRYDPSVPFYGQDKLVIPTPTSIEDRLTVPKFKLPFPVELGGLSSAVGKSVITEYLPEDLGSDLPCTEFRTRMVYGSRYQPVVVTQEKQGLRLYDDSDWRFINSSAWIDSLCAVYDEYSKLSRSVSAARYVEYGYSVPVSRQSLPDHGNPFICGRCGEDVRFVAHCVPKQLEAPRKSYDNGNTVDANPNRPELV